MGDYQYSHNFPFLPSGFDYFVVKFITHKVFEKMSQSKND